ncbi:MAG: aldo/keto reductase, partial [Dysgonamonadaceae bacterium]
MKYSFCGRSGLQLPAISLGLWHNFGFVDDFDTAEQMILYAFEQGITHFDLANNYGPPPGSAETNFGKILKKNLASHRDEMIISSKAGHRMWPGPYGDGSSRKYLMASIDQSLQRTGLEYFDIFYSHRYDPSTPVEETMQALVDIVHQGKALYVGISKYPPLQAIEAMTYLKEHDVPCLIFQDRYNMFQREPEKETLNIAKEF